MIRVLGYLLLAGLALLLQTVLLPPFFPGGTKPDLILLLAIWIALREPAWHGGALVYVLGWIYDAYAGTFPGLHGFVLLTVFLTIAGMATRLNTESLPLVWCLVGGGTLLQGALTVFAIEFFADTRQFWVALLRALPSQLVLNLAAAYVLRALGLRLSRFYRRLPIAFPSFASRRHAP